MTQEIVNQNRDKRDGRGRVIALSRRVYRIENTDVFYVESESCDGMYYYVMFNTDKAFEWCSCKDFEKNRYQVKCKHLAGVEYAIRWATVIDTDKLPLGIKKDNSTTWRDDLYDF